MIDVECPHCKRILKVSEKFIGAEGACKHCGGRLVIAANMPQPEFDASPRAAILTEHVSPESGTQQETIDVLTANIEVMHAQLSQDRRDIERLANELEAERAARIRAETAHRMMEVRTRRVQEQFRRLIQDKTGPEDVSEAVASEGAIRLCIDSMAPGEDEIDHAIGNPKLKPEIELASEAEAPKEESAKPAPKPKRTWKSWAAASLTVTEDCIEMVIENENQGAQRLYNATQYDRRPQRYPAFVGATFAHALLMMLRRKRVILAAGLSLMPVAIPLVLAFLSTMAFAEDGNRVFVRLMEFLYLRALVPLLALFFGCMAIGEDVESQVIPYLLTRPLPRSAIVLGKFGAYWLVSSVIVCLSVLLTFAACTALGGLDFTQNTLVMLAHYEGVASLALFGYGALAIFLGAAMKRPIIIGIVIIFGWQRFAYYMPGVVDFLTIEKYVLALLPRLATQRENIVLKTAFAEFQKQQLFIDAPKALASLLILSGIFLLCTSLIVRWREYSVARTIGG